MVYLRGIPEEGSGLDPPTHLLTELKNSQGANHCLYYFYMLKNVGPSFEKLLVDLMYDNLYDY